METIRIYVPIEPKPAPRPRVTRNGTYNDPKYTSYKQAIALVAKSKIRQPYEEGIYMKIEFFFNIPKSWSKQKQAEAKWHTSRPDLDNLQKGVKDALNGIVYKDDSQVCFIQARKQYAKEAGILIEILKV